MDSLVYVIAGKEDSLVNAKCRQLIDQLLEPSDRAMGLFKAENDTLPACEVLDELRTAPFLTNKRVVVVQKADKFISENRELLEKYFDNPCPTGRLILTVKGWDARTKLAKKLSKAGTLISVTAPRRRDLPGYVAKYASDAHNKKLSRDAAELLVELTGDELPRLYSEIDKLAVFADTDKVITYEHIESLIGDNRLFNAFAVIEAIISGDTAAAVKRLRAMFEADKSTEYTTLGAFAYHLRRMFRAKAMLEKGISHSVIEKKLLIWSNKEKFFAQLRRIPLKQIGLYLQQLAETDYAIKTGRTKIPVAIEQFILKLAK